MFWLQFIDCNMLASEDTKGDADTNNSTVPPVVKKAKVETKRYVYF